MKEEFREQGGWAYVEFYGDSLDVLKVVIDSRTLDTPDKKVRTIDDLLRAISRREYVYAYGTGKLNHCGDARVRVERRGRFYIRVPMAFAIKAEWVEVDE